MVCATDSVLKLTTAPCSVHNSVDHVDDYIDGVRLSLWT